MWAMGTRTLNVGTGQVRESISSLPSVMLSDWEISGDFHTWPTGMEEVWRDLMPVFDFF